MDSPFLGTVYEPFDFMTRSSHVMVIHANPSVADSPALNRYVRSKDEMQALSDESYQILCEALPENSIVQKLPIEGFLTIALGLSLPKVFPEHQEQGLIAQLNAAFSGALEQIEAELGIVLCLSVSALHRNTQNVYDAYQEAFSIAVHYPFLPRPQRITFYQRFQAGLSPSETAAKELLERQFLDLMTEKRYLDAEPVLLQLVRLRAATPRTVISLTQELIARLTFFAYQLLDGADMPSVSRERILDRIDRIHSVKSMADLESHLHGILALMEELRETAEHSSDLGWTGKLSDYIKNNYANPAMNAALLSEVFGLNPAYISHIFHQGSGVKLVDYIHMTRIEHIKDLLKQTDMSLGDIAQKTGYYDRRSMSRVFCRYMGMTPSEYRNR